MTSLMSKMWDRELNLWLSNLGLDKSENPQDSQNLKLIRKSPLLSKWILNGYMAIDLEIAEITLACWLMALLHIMLLL